ncbi:MAG: Hpt domain-containing protein [Bdellovibrionaceae bacterium]|nr:Hpt domain-containing protein [Pseudobdellovibrionaceae bacterium]
MHTSEQPMYSIYHNDPLYRSLFASFSDRASHYIQKIDDACSHHDTAALVTLLHEIKGVYGNYGFPVIAEIAKTLEDELKNNITPPTPKWMALKDNIKRVANTYQRH